jgi:hypothetical protein
MTRLTGMTSTTCHECLPLVLAAAIAALPLALAACDGSESKSRTTTTKTRETPDGGVKQTTETTEKKIETTPK